MLVYINCHDLQVIYEIKLRAMTSSFNTLAEGHISDPAHQDC